MANNNRVAGLMFVKVDGDQLPLGEGTVTLGIVPATREGVAGLSGPVGYKETPRVQHMEFECRTRGDLDVQALHDLGDGLTVVAECANKQVWSLGDAWLAGEPDPDVGEGTVTLRFEGMRLTRTA